MEAVIVLRRHVFIDGEQILADGEVRRIGGGAAGWTVLRGGLFRLAWAAVVADDVVAVVVVVVVVVGA